MDCLRNFSIIILMDIANNNNKPVFLKILGNKRVLSELIMLLADIRHILNQDDSKTITLHINNKHGSNPILFTVNDQEIEDYKPSSEHYIN